MDYAQNKIGLHNEAKIGDNTKRREYFHGICKILKITVQNENKRRESSPQKVTVASKIEKSRPKSRDLQ